MTVDKCDKRGCENEAKYGVHGLKDSEAYSILLCESCYNKLSKKGRPLSKKEKENKDGD